jgi:hypothetical protein
MTSINSLNRMPPDIALFFISDIRPFAGERDKEASRAGEESGYSQIIPAHRLSLIGGITHARRVDLRIFKLERACIITI